MKIIDSNFSSNLAYLGGALYLQHGNGIVFFTNSIFLMNKASTALYPGGKENLGGAIAWNCFTPSLIISYGNFFINNTAGQGILSGISGTFSDENSILSGFIFSIYSNYINFRN